MRVLVGSALVLGIMLGGAGIASGVRAQSAPAKVVRSDLSGHWVLNEKLSDKMGPPGGGPGGGGGMRGGPPGGMGGGGRGGRGGGPPGGMSGGGPNGPPPDMAEGGPPGDGAQEQRGGRTRMLRDMVVEQYEEQILLSERGKIERMLVFKSGDLPRMSEEGVPQAKAAWDHGKLVIEEVTPRGRVLETWELARKGQQLVVLTRIQRGEDSFNRKRIYDRTGDD